MNKPSVPAPTPYRWLVLASFMLVNLLIQILWISYAPITTDAAQFYRVSELAIGLFAMLYMIVYVPLALPVAWTIDRWGFRLSTALGSLLMALFALIRAAAGNRYGIALVGTLGLAVAQPFYLNAWTKMPAHWHPQNERATAVGLITLSNLLGIALGMVLTPLLLTRFSIDRIQWIYALGALVGALLFVAIAREYPKNAEVPPAARETKLFLLPGLHHALRSGSFRIFLIIVFIGMGLFNGVTTWIEQIVQGRGFKATDAGTLGALLLIGGVVGAVVIPALSDLTGRRKPWMFLSLVASIPFLLGMTGGRTFFTLALSSFFLGFFLTSVMPIGMQYSVEITRPTPEGTSNGLIQLFGQISVVCVFLMQILRDKGGSFTLSLSGFAILLGVCALLVLFTRESYPKRG